MRVTKVSTVFLLTAVVAFLSTGVDAGDEVMFAYTFADGYEQAYKVKFSQEVDAGFMTMSIFADLEVTEKFIAAEEESFQMEMVFDKVDASLMMFDQMQDAPISENLTGKSVFFTVDRHGSVTDIKAADYIEGWDRISQIVEPVIEGGFAYLPNREVAMGGSWEPEAEEDTGNDMTITHTGEIVFMKTAKEKGRECSYVEGKTQSVIGGTIDSGMGAANADGKGESEFEFYFDAANSIVVKMKQKTDVKMELTPEAGGDSFETVVNYSLEREIK